MKKNTIVIITPNPDTFSNPSLVSFFEHSKDELRIFLLGPNQLFENTFSNVKCIKANLFYNYGLNRSILRKILYLGHIVLVMAFFKFIQKPKAIIGVDPLGFIWAGFIKKILSFKKLVYWSFEIFPLDECGEGDKSLKRKENSCMKHCDLLIIQDEVRKELLLNDIQEAKNTLLMPVSLSSKVSMGSSLNIRSHYKISKDQIILIYSGSVAKWSGIYEILDALLKKLSSDFVIILHSRFKGLEKDEYLNRLKNLNTRVQFIISEIPFEDIRDLMAFVAQCDVGLVSYLVDFKSIYTGKNIEKIGLSSGKFSLYAKQGLSIVSLSNDTYDELNTRYNFGSTFKSSDEVPELVFKLKKDLASHKKSSLKLYDEILNPTEKINSLIEFVNS